MSGYQHIHKSIVSMIVTTVARSFRDGVNLWSHGMVNGYDRSIGGVDSGDEALSYPHVRTSVVRILRWR